VFFAPTRAVVIAWLVSRAVDVGFRSTDLVMAVDRATWDGSGGALEGATASAAPSNAPPAFRA
jgi:hypothetical protein